MPNETKGFVLMNEAVAREMHAEEKPRSPESYLVPEIAIPPDAELIELDQEENKKLLEKVLPFILDKLRRAGATEIELQNYRVAVESFIANKPSQLIFENRGGFTMETAFGYTVSRIRVPDRSDLTLDQYLEQVPLIDEGVTSKSGAGYKKLDSSRLLQQMKVLARKESTQDAHKKEWEDLVKDSRRIYFAHDAYHVEQELSPGDAWNSFKARYDLNEDSISTEKETELINYFISHVSAGYLPRTLVSKRAYRLGTEDVQDMSVLNYSEHVVDILSRKALKDYFKEDTKKLLDIHNKLVLGIEVFRKFNEAETRVVIPGLESEISRLMILADIYFTEFKDSSEAMAYFESSKDLSGQDIFTTERFSEFEFYNLITAYNARVGSKGVRQIFPNGEVFYSDQSSDFAVLPESIADIFVKVYLDCFNKGVSPKKFKNAVNWLSERSKVAGVTPDSLVNGVELYFGIKITEEEAIRLSFCSSFVEPSKYEVRGHKYPLVRALQEKIYDEFEKIAPQENDSIVSMLTIKMKATLDDRSCALITGLAKNDGRKDARIVKREWEEVTSGSSLGVFNVSFSELNTEEQGEFRQIYDSCEPVNWYYSTEKQDEDMEKFVNFIKRVKKYEK